MGQGAALLSAKKPERCLPPTYCWVSSKTSGFGGVWGRFEPSSLGGESKDSGF